MTAPAGNDTVLRVRYPEPRPENILEREKRSGYALIVGAVAGVVTMGLHPTGASLLAAGDGAAHLARVAVLAHGLALAGIPVSFAGAAGLSRRVGGGVAPLVVYATALVAGACATVFSGLVGPDVGLRMMEAEGARHEALSVAFLYTGLVGRAFTGVFVVASSAAVVLWSAAILRRRTLPRGLGVAGAAIGAITLLAYLSGHVPLDVHGFGILLAAQSAWLAAAGVALIRARS